MTICSVAASSKELQKPFEIPWLQIVVASPPSLYEHTVARKCTSLRTFPKYSCVVCALLDVQVAFCTQLASFIVVDYLHGDCNFNSIFQLAKSETGQYFCLLYRATD